MTRPVLGMPFMSLHCTRQSLLVLAFLLLAQVAAGQEGLRSPKDTFSSSFGAHVFDGVPICQRLFPGGGSHITYVPPARLPDSDPLTIPASAFTLNGSLCNSPKGASFRVSKTEKPTPGAPPSPFPGIIVNQLPPGALKVLLFGDPSTDDVPQCRGVDGGGATASIVQFSIMESSADVDILSPRAPPGTPPKKYIKDTIYMFLLLDIAGLERVPCVMSSEGVKAPRSVSASEAGSRGSGSSSGRRRREEKETSGGKLGVGAISGIVVGVTIVVAIVIVLLTVAHRAVYRRRNSSGYGSERTPNGSEPPSMRFSDVSQT